MGANLHNQLAHTTAAWNVTTEPLWRSLHVLTVPSCAWKLLSQSWTSILLFLTYILKVLHNQGYRLMKTIPSQTHIVSILYLPMQEHLTVVRIHWVGSKGPALLAAEPSRLMEHTSATTEMLHRQRRRTSGSNPLHLVFVNYSKSVNANIHFIQREWSENAKHV